MEAVTLAYEIPDESDEQAPTRPDRERFGAVYTPVQLANWVAALSLEFARSAPLDVLDLGCGEGALLAAVARVSLEAHLTGVDTNAGAVRQAKLELPFGSRLIVGDVLDQPKQAGTSLSDFWVARFTRAPNVLIMNPPWGATHTVSSITARQMGLKLANGQYDTYDLFCELGIQVLAEGGTYALILPDSLFLPEHQQLRELLATRTTIELIARLGEGVFPDVYRGCVVVVGRKMAALSNHTIECIRLTKSGRSRVLSDVGFADARAAVSHRVLQSRFTADRHFRFDIDVSLGDQTVFKIGEQGGEWTKYLASSRGTEISKHGKVLICSTCKTSHPRPKNKKPRCRECGTFLDVQDIRTIVSTQRPDGELWAPFLVGEDVTRYEAAPRRWIKLGVPGIKYKKRASRGEARLLIRKTGVGIHATVDTSDAVTNQVVFDYKLQPNVALPFSYLHYVLGVISSRAMFAYHLKRSGELEWRSHPYITQKTIALLPVPVPSEATTGWKQAKAIASAVQRHLKSGAHDLEIEGLVAGLFHLSDEDLAWTQRVISEAADLEPMRRLRVQSPADLRVIWAE